MTATAPTRPATGAGHGLLRSRPMMLAVAVVVIGALAVGAWRGRQWAVEGLLPGAVGPLAPPTPAELDRASSTRVFFAHQSVGSDVLNGVESLYRGHGMTPPAVIERPATAQPDGGRILHATVGRNGDPLGKIADFERQIHSGAGATSDVALMKLCYVDFDGTTDVETVFQAYQSTMAALQRKYPGVAFVATTVPLTTNHPDNPARFLLTGALPESEAGVARERYNALVRATYGPTGRLFDVAAVESTTPDGHRTGSRHRGQQFATLHRSYAADEGHLNEEGRRRAAGAFVKVVAAVAGGRT